MQKPVYKGNVLCFMITKVHIKTAGLVTALSKNITHYVVNRHPVLPVCVFVEYNKLCAF